jgi:hypothetical protein
MPVSTKAVNSVLFWLNYKPRVHFANLMRGIQILSLHGEDPGRGLQGYNTV